MPGVISYISENPIYVISNIIIICIWCAFADIVHEHKYRYRVNIIVHAVVTLLYFIPCVFPLKGIIGVAFYFVMLLIQALILYRDSFARKLLSVVIILLAMLTAELINMLVFFSPDYIEYGAISSTPYYQILNFSTYTFLTIAILLSAAVFLKKSEGKRKYPLSYSLLLFIAFAIETALICPWTFALTGDDPTQTHFLLIVIFLCIVGNSALFITIRAMQSKSDLKAENRSLETMVKTQEEYYSALTDQYEDIRKMRHDIANHMYTISILLEDGKGDEAAEYARELSERQHYSSSLGNCENHVLDAFLHHRIEELSEIGIKTDVKIKLRQNTNVSNCDLISVFGNLLDNAAEACSTNTDAEISIVSELRGNYLFISVENPMPDSTKEKKRRIPELERGLGTKILQNLAEKYDGDFKCEAADGMHSATVLLKAFNDT